MISRRVQLCVATLLCLVASGTAHAEPCRSESFRGASYTVCSFDPTKDNLRTYWRGDNGKPYRTFAALAEDLEGLDRGAQVQEALQRIAATTACHAAVKANYPLTYEKMTHILDELRATAYSTVCPHGRPVMLRITRREIEKNFERI